MNRYQRIINFSRYNSNIVILYMGKIGVPIVVQRKQIGLVSMKMWVRSLASLSGPGIWCVAMSCGVGRRYGSDPRLLWLWLWCRPAAIAPAPVQPLM